MRYIVLLLIILTTLFIITPPPIHARITPEDIVNEKRAAYEAKIKTYLPANQQKLTQLEKAIAQVNKSRSEELEAIMFRQGQILDEYQSRKGGIETEAIKDARYWLTFAHEAIDYQKARIYIFNLTNESNIKSDANNLVASLQSQLNYARAQAIKSQNTISKTVAGLGSQKIAPEVIGGGE